MFTIATTNEPYDEFCAEIAAIEAQATQAPTWEKAMDFIPLLRAAWDRHGFYGAWRHALEDAIQRIVELDLPVEAPDYWPWEVVAA